MTSPARRAAIAVLCLTLVVALVAAGCSSDAPDKQTEPTKTKTPAKKTPVAPPPEPKLSVMDLHKQSECSNNLHQLGIAIAAWAAANDGKIPEEVQQLIDAQKVPAALFKCPLASGDRKIDYFYVSYKPSKAAPDRIVACDIEPHGGAGGKRCVLFVDGSVKPVSAAEFRELMASKANQSVVPVFKALVGQP